MEPLEQRQMLTTWIVNTNIDENDGIGAGGISLRDAIFAAAAEGDRIEFDPAALDINERTIVLQHGQMAFGKSLTIDASMLSSGITIDANDPTPGHTGHGIRIFNIEDPSSGTEPPEVALIGLTLTGADVGNNERGGAIRSEARLVLRDCIIKENEAIFGGGIYVEVAGGGSTSREVLVIEDSDIRDNFAGTGAGVAIVSRNGDSPTTDTIVITGNSTISYNKATDGGGVYAELFGATMTIADSTLALNESLEFGPPEPDPAGLGGGMYAVLNHGATLIFTGATVEDNKGTWGAGLYVDVLGESTLRLDQTIFDNNDVTADGGGVVAAADNGTVEVTRSEFRHNGAARGGGFFAHGVGTSTFTIDRTLFEFNDADQGGGMYVNVISSSAVIEDSSFDNNDVIDSGGGVYANLVGDDAAVEIVNSTITLNEALVDGGGLYGKIAEDADALLEIHDSQITGNQATVGGGMRVNLADVHMSADGSEFKVERSRLEGNHAVSRGGGIFTTVGAGGKVTVNESVITGNDAGITLSNGSGSIQHAGGGIYAYLWTDVTASTLTIAGTEISNNTAGLHGGGIALCTKRNNMSSEYSKLSVYNTTISGNEVLPATGNPPIPGTGGGVHIGIFNASGQRLDAHFQNTTITENVADEGGGVWTSRPLPDTGHDSRNNVWLTNSIASANKDHNEQPNNLWGSFNVVRTVFNLIGSGNSIANEEGNPASLSSQNLLDEDDPRLDPLAWNGGPTRTHRPKSGGPGIRSRAIDAGSNELAIIPFSAVPPNPATPLTTDQRGEGFPRIHDIPAVANDPDETVDMGAYEIGFAKVIDVVVSSTEPNEFGTNPPYHFKEVVGSEAQLLTVPVGSADRIAAQFSEPVIVSHGDLGIIALNRIVNEPSRTFGAPDAGNNFTATWTFDSALEGAQYLLRLQDTIQDLHGRGLDGEWENPVSILTHVDSSKFPSGDNLPGGDFDLVFTILPGDALRDLIVDGGDYNLLLSNWQQQNRSWAQGDFNGEGSVDGGDYNALVSFWLEDWKTLKILGDFNNDYAIDEVDEGIFNTGGADLNGDGVINAADEAALEELLDFGIELDVA